MTYPGRLLDKLFDYNNDKEKFIGPEKCPVYLKLQWLGDISEGSQKRHGKDIFRDKTLLHTFY